LIPDSAPAVTVLEGLDRINAALDLATARCLNEVVTVQPGGARPAHALAEGLDRARLIADRGIQMRTLYQHTVRHSYGVLAYLDRLTDVRAEIRTLEELTPRLLVFDRTVAFIPGTPTASHTALELRAPGVVDFLLAAFDRFWEQAIPLNEPLPDDPAPDGTSGIRRSIARLLVKGHVDEEIAHRLGLHVRTCRAHIARLSAALGGSTNRAQLGYLIARSNILDD
jgi:hypothetical protein